MNKFECIKKKRLYERQSRADIMKSIKEKMDRMDKVVLYLTPIFIVSFLVNMAYTADIIKRFNPIIEIISRIVEFITGIIPIIYYLLSKYFLKNQLQKLAQVITDEQCESIKKWLRNINYTDKHLEKCECKIRYVGLADIDILSELNVNAFKGTEFEISLEETKTRNKGFLTWNDKCFMLMIDPIDGDDIIGYSCILPMNELGADLYKDGSIPDARLRAELIAKPSEKPSAILLFAIHLKDEYSTAKSGASRQYILYFLNCIRLHLKSIYPEHYKNGNLPPLYAQTRHDSIKRMLKRMGFIETEFSTGDDCKIWEYNPSSEAPGML